MSFAVDYRVDRPIALAVGFEVRGFTALLGRSGAGKTTLLRALAGLVPATGSPWAGVAPERRPVGYLPQAAALFPHLTVLQNAAYALRGPGRLAEAQALLNALGLGELAGRSAATLSGGEAQRVALARALARAPDLLLLDEPSAALDATTREEVLAWLIATIGRQRIPALAATHDPLIANMADHLVLLHGGAIIQEGAPREVFHNPVSAAAARLLGYGNVWTEGGVAYAIRAGDIKLASSGHRATVLSARAEAHGVRLECAAPHRLTVWIPGIDGAPIPAGETVFLAFGDGKLRRLPS